VRAAAVAAAVLALAVPAAYAVAGGGRYGPRPVADPCAARAWHTTGGVTGLAAQLALSATDGAACRLGVSRESLVLALATRANLSDFARTRHLSDAQVEAAMRDGLQRAINDATRAGALGVIPALVLSQAVRQLPVDRLFRALQGTTLTW
jgi:hypothetical protein